MSKTMSTPSRPQPGLPVSKRGLKGYFAEVKREIKKVNWPTPHETNRLTGIVLVVCAIIVLVLFGLSQVADTLVSLLTKGRVG